MVCPTVDLTSASKWKESSVVIFVLPIHEPVTSFTTRFTDDHSFLLETGIVMFLSHRKHVVCCVLCVKECGKLQKNPTWWMLKDT